MRLGNKWVAAPVAGLVLLIGGIGIASAVSGDDRPANVVTTTPALANDPGTLSVRDSASHRNDDRTGAAGQEDSASDRNDDRAGAAGQDPGSLTGSSVRRARAAALAAVPGATVREVEPASSASGAAWHVELIQGDGAKVEVELNASFETVKIQHSGQDS
jgi:uncharacterized membrane protein YkoI